MARWIRESMAAALARKLCEKPNQQAFWTRDYSGSFVIKTLFEASESEFKAVFF